jgi:hypothetical protein
LINKFIKHNQVNYPCCDMNYLDLHLSLSFFNFVFIYCWWVFFFHFFMLCLLICLIRCVHDFFELHIRIVLYKKKHVENLCKIIFVYYVLKSSIWSLFLLFLFFPWLFFIKSLLFLISPFNQSLYCFIYLFCSSFFLFFWFFNVFIPFNLTLKIENLLLPYDLFLLFCNFNPFFIVVFYFGFLCSFFV